MTETKVFVYLLLDPRTQVVRYVGCSMDPERRLKQHVFEAGSAVYGNPRNARVQWLKDLHYHGLSPLMVVLFECERDEGQEIERDLIKRFVEIGVPLANTNHNPDIMANYAHPLRNYWGVDIPFYR